MHVARTIPELRHHRLMIGDSSPLALVPTMGALHEGHLSLFDLARHRVGPGGHVAASVFVNPTQFHDQGDFDAYPRELDADLNRLEDAGVDLVFAPIEDEMYPITEPMVLVDVPALTDRLEGAHRPGHFQGVCRVVLKLFNLVAPDVALFGMKDFQQLRVIEAMTAGVNLPIEIVRAPTLRDPDGLAMSSRNRRLNDAQRQRALAIPRALDAAVRKHHGGERDPLELRQTMSDELLESGPADVPFQVDYAVIVDPATLEPVQRAQPPVLLAIAAHVGQVRLIDNWLIEG